MTAPTDPTTPAGTPGYPPDVPDAGFAAAATVAVAVFPDYDSAQRAVDFLSDNKFPVEKVAIPRPP